MVFLAPIKYAGFTAWSMAGLSLAGLVSASFAVTWLDALSPFIGAAVAGLGTYLSFRQKRNEDRLAQVEQANENRHAWVDQIQDQLDREIRNAADLRRMFNRMYRLLLVYHYGTPKLLAQIIALGLQPDWMPPTDDEVEGLITGQDGKQGAPDRG